MLDDKSAIQVSILLLEAEKKSRPQFGFALHVSTESIPIGEITFWLNGNRAWPRKMAGEVNPHVHLRLHQVSRNCGKAHIFKILHHMRPPAGGMPPLQPGIMESSHSRWQIIASKAR